MEAEDEDPVVAELDVQLCNGALGDKTELCLFQYPLRPPWRPYDFGDGTTLRVKPEAQRVEMTVPLDTRGDNYDASVPSEQRLKELRLRSSPAALPAPLAMAMVRDGRLLLLPVSQAFSLRPDLSHLDPPPQPAKAEEKGAAKAEAARESTAIQPQIQKRETERQQRARLASYAHLARREAEEPWREVEFVQAGVLPLVLQKLGAAPEQPLPMALSRREYLDALLPAVGGPEGAPPVAPKAEPQSAWQQRANGAGAATAGPSSAAATAAGPSSEAAAAAAVAAAPPLAPELAAALSRSLGDLFRSHPVADLRGVRHWLGVARDAAQLEGLAAGPDAELQAAVAQTGLARQLQGAFVSCQAGSTEGDALRKVVLDIAAKQASFRKAEVAAAAQKAGLQAGEAALSRALREVCQSRGAAWSLKRVWSGGPA